MSLGRNGYALGRPKGLPPSHVQSRMLRWTISSQSSARARGEECMFRVAHAYEQATAWHKEKPPL